MATSGSGGGGRSGARSAIARAVAIAKRNNQNVKQARRYAVAGQRQASTQSSAPF